MDILDKLYQKGVSRRNFLAGAGALGAATALAGCNDSGTTPTQNTTSPAPLNDTDILNFALNLEYLEAEFYLYAATGQGLSAADAGSGAGTTIIPAATKLTGLTTVQQNFVNELAVTEQAHVRFLRTALGTAAVPRPAIDLTFFGPLAVAAGITTSPTFFTPFASYDAFLTGAFIFEDVGVTAYNGAAPLISAAGVAAGYLAAAAGIMATEAYHAAAIRTQITGNAIAAESFTTTTNTTPNVTSTTYAPFGYAQKIGALRSTLGGGGETILTLPNTTAIPYTAPMVNPIAPVYTSAWGEREPAAQMGRGASATATATATAKEWRGSERDRACEGGVRAGCRAVRCGWWVKTASSASDPAPCGPGKARTPHGFARAKVNSGDAERRDAAA